MYLQKHDSANLKMQTAKSCGRTGRPLWDCELGGLSLCHCPSSRMITNAPLTAVAQRGVGARAQWLVLAAAALGWKFDGMEMGIFPLVSKPALQNMMPFSAAGGQDQFVGLWMGSITVLILIGAATGGLWFGVLGA